MPTHDSKPAINYFTPAPKEIIEMEDTDMEDSLCSDADFMTKVFF